MSIGVIEPLSFRELLTDPIYRAHVLRTPRLPSGARTAMPWVVRGVRADGKWASKLFPEYREGFDLVKKMLKQPDTYSDVVITCRPIAFGPPANYVMPTGLHWCGHCRRPSVFRRMHSHVAMRKWPVISDDDVLRCFYCAGRGPQRVFHW